MDYSCPLLMDSCCHLCDWSIVSLKQVMQVQPLSIRSDRRLAILHPAKVRYTSRIKSLGID